MSIAKKKEAAPPVGGQFLRMYIIRIPVKLDRNTFRTKTEVGFRPMEKAEHQGCCDRIPPESGWNRNPAQDSGPQKTGTKTGMCHLANTGESKQGCNGEGGCGGKQTRADEGTRVRAYPWQDAVPW